MIQINQIQLTQIGTNDSQGQELPLTKAELTDYKQQYDKQGIQKKTAYLQVIQSHNKELIGKIKELDKKLNAQIDVLSKKIVSPSKKRQPIPKVQDLQTAQLQNKFKELEKIKRQLQQKRTGINSLDFLLSIRQKQKMKLLQLKKQIAILKQKLGAFNKMKEKYTSKDQKIQSEVAKMGEFSIYDNQIQQLRKKVHQKSQLVKSKKEDFFKLYNQNRSNVTVLAQPESARESAVQEDPELLALKQKYFEMGKKIEILKSKKAILLKGNVDCSEQKRTIQKLKQKLENIRKLTNK